MRHCSRCNRNLPQDQFYTNGARWHSWCKSCHLKDSAERRQHRHSSKCLVKTSKQCTICNAEKPLTEFSEDRGSPDGHHSWCKLCRNKAARGRYSKLQRQTTVKRRYGVTMEDVEALRVVQSGRCAICSVPFAETRPCIDHDHDSGAVRGLLCIRCNTGLGMFGDDLDLLKRAADYLCQTAMSSNK